MNQLPKISDIPSSITSDICRADSDLFYQDYSPLQKHCINVAPFLSFEEALFCYEHNPRAEMESSIKSLDPDNLSPSQREALNKLWKRSRAATCSAVLDIWIKENPTAYLDFTASGKRLGDYIKSIGVSVK